MAVALKLDYISDFSVIEQVIIHLFYPSLSCHTDTYNLS